MPVVVQFRRRPPQVPGRQSAVAVELPVGLRGQCQNPAPAVPGFRPVGGCRPSSVLTRQVAVPVRLDFLHRVGTLGQRVLQSPDILQQVVVLQG